ncbi:uncharacterized protein [Taeniopygia guttata]|uniref:uncharacterized protein n=1 Tax=Taeniopygia guttata TaxID=59729 RepID=UPI003BB8AF0F
MIDSARSQSGGAASRPSATAAFPPCAPGPPKPSRDPPKPSRDHHGLPEAHRDRELQVLQGPPDHRALAPLHRHHRPQWLRQIQPEGRHQLRAGGEDSNLRVKRRQQPVGEDAAGPDPRAPVASPRPAAPSQRGLLRGGAEDRTFARGIVGSSSVQDQQRGGAAERAQRGAGEAGNAHQGRNCLVCQGAVESMAMKNQADPKPGLEQNQNQNQNQTDPKPGFEQNQNQNQNQADPKPGFEQNQNQNQNQADPKPRSEQNQNQNQNQADPKPSFEQNQNQNQADPKPSFEQNQNRLTQTLSPQAERYQQLKDAVVRARVQLQLFTLFHNGAEMEKLNEELGLKDPEMDRDKRGWTGQSLEDELTEEVELAKRCIEEINEELNHRVVEQLGDARIDRQGRDHGQHPAPLPRLRVWRLIDLCQENPIPFPISLTHNCSP